MSSRPRSPAEKKRLSYERDGRNTYGETDKGSRKSIPRFKAKSNRKARHISTQEVTVANVAGDLLDGAETRLNDRLGKHKRAMHRKAPDTPLGLTLVIDGKLPPEKAASKRAANKALRREQRFRLPKTASR